MAAPENLSWWASGQAEGMKRWDESSTDRRKAAGRRNVNVSHTRKN